MKLISWNVQGLGGPICKRSKGRFCKELKTANSGGPIDILLLQEHHLNKRRVDSYGSPMPGQ